MRLAAHEMVIVKIQGGSKKEEKDSLIKFNSVYFYIYINIVSGLCTKSNKSKKPSSFHGITSSVFHPQHIGEN